MGTPGNGPQIATVSVQQIQSPIQGQPQVVSSSCAGSYRQVIVTDASGNKIHEISGTNQTSGLTLPQKPAPPGITLLKPAVTSASIAASTQGGTHTPVDKKPILSTVSCSILKQIPT